MSIVDPQVELVAEYEYDPYGNIVSQSGPLTDVNPLRYRGYVFDSETQFYYLQSRYYDPELGRFLNADALVSTGQGILGNNMFAYCLNNPIIAKDTTGKLSHSYDLVSNQALVYGANNSRIIIVRFPSPEIIDWEENDELADLIAVVKTVLGINKIRKAMVILSAPAPSYVNVAVLVLWGIWSIATGAQELSD